MDAAPGSKWESRLIPGVYDRESSIEILRKHSGVYHPVAGTFGKLLAASERIIRTPLRQRVWEEEEIRYGNVAVIGDAARLMLPNSGQGTSFAIEDATVLANSLLNNRSETIKLEKPLRNTLLLESPDPRRWS